MRRTSDAMRFAMNTGRNARAASLPGLVALLAFLQAGCATTDSLPASPAARALPAAALQLAAPAPPEPSLAAITALDEGMRAFLEWRVSGANDEQRLHSLLGAVISNPTFRVEYGDETRSAVETFQRMRGNCLSFTSLLVGLAREVGLSISYQEVDVPPIWSLRDGSFVLTRHVNAVVKLAPDFSQVVDFNMAEFRLAYPRREISDERAAAHFHSNLGVERMQAGEAERARQHFAYAIALDPTLAQAWINLGIWYGREGDPARAEASFLEALRVDPRELVAMSNLANLHAREGRAALARSYEQRVARFRAQNPYYRLALARDAYRAGDYATAVDHLQHAIHRAPDEAEFHSWLALSYRQLGRVEPARRELERAVELADEDETRRAYRRKLEILAAGG
jgi:Flp pilus assembly protein TadD